MENNGGMYRIGFDPASPGGDRSATVLYYYKDGEWTVLGCEERMSRFGIWWTVLKWRVQGLFKRQPNNT